MMRCLFRRTTLASVLAILAAVAWAEPPVGGPMRGLSQAMLLGQESVRKELKLSAEQLKRAEELSDKMRAKMWDVFAGAGAVEVGGTSPPARRTGPARPARR
jgi:hypothetical protein